MRSVIIVLLIFLAGIFMIQLPVLAVRATSTPTITVTRQPEGILTAIKNKIKELMMSARITGTLSSASVSPLTVVTKNNRNYLVYLSDKTKWLRRFWGSSSLSEINQGDQLNVIGKWKNADKTRIDADLIRNLSVQKRNGVFIGTVKGKNDTALTVETLQRETQTVIIDTETKFVNRSERGIGFTDIKVGDRVRVKGLWDRSAKTVTEVTQVKDFNL